MYSYLSVVVAIMIMFSAQNHSCSICRTDITVDKWITLCTLIQNSMILDSVIVQILKVYVHVLESLRIKQNKSHSEMYRTFLTAYTDE